MAVTLYDATVAGFVQTIGAMEGVLARGLAHCQDNGIDPAEIVGTRLYGDMLPLRYQVVAMVDHSRNAIAGAGKGVFSPGRDPTPYDYAGLQDMLAATRGGLQAMQPADVNALEDVNMEFRMGDMVMPFTGAGFLLSFSVPNFHFHATTAYDILRSKGVPLGKRDYLGRLRLRA